MANKWLTATALAVGMVAIPTAASAESQWRLFGGISDVGDINYNNYGYEGEISTDSGFVVGAAYGVVHGDWVIEGELSYRSADLSELELFGYSYEVDGSLSATALMANAWYNFPTSGSWGFYAGGGVGMANAEIEAEGYTDDSTEFAWQLGAGLNVRTQSGFAYGVGYRYFNLPEIGDTEADITAHEVIFEISSRF